jgi:hypothetical protein
MGVGKVGEGFVKTIFLSEPSCDGLGRGERLVRIVRLGSIV